VLIIFAQPNLDRVHTRVNLHNIKEVSSVDTEVIVVLRHTCEGMRYSSTGVLHGGLQRSTDAVRGNHFGDTDAGRNCVNFDFVFLRPKVCLSATFGAIAKEGQKILLAFIWPPVGHLVDGIVPEVVLPAGSSLRFHLGCTNTVLPE